jgi:N-acetylglutamate synthase-like GNAT family acetyltransferase
LLLLSVSAASRLVGGLINEGLLCLKEGEDKREKYLGLTQEGRREIEDIDRFSNAKIKGAFDFLTQEDQASIIKAIQKYGDALEKSRLLTERVKIHTLSTSRPLRKEIMDMIGRIQKDEYALGVTDEINAGILRAEQEYYYHRSYNFWYALDEKGNVIGSIGLKKIDDENAEIKKFFVAQKYRGKGVAQKLMSALLKAALKHHFNCLYLGTVGTLLSAQGFYKKYGFTQVSQQSLPSNFDLCPVDTVFFTSTVEDLKKNLL